MLEFLLCLYVSGIKSLRSLMRQRVRQKQKRCSTRQQDGTNNATDIALDFRNKCWKLEKNLRASLWEEGSDVIQK
jgi:hypothetical protein